MLLWDGHGFDDPTSSIDANGIGRADSFRIEDGGIERARTLSEAIVEAALKAGARFGIGVDGNAPLGDEEHAAQVIDAVRVVGVRMGVEHSVDMLDAGGEQLLAQVWRRVDQHGRSAALAKPFNQQGAAPTPIFWVGRIAVAPDIAHARYPAGRATAQDREAHAHAVMADRGVLA